MLCLVEAGELAPCHWCGTLIVKNDIDMLCVGCGISFSNQSSTPCLWDEDVNNMMSHEHKISKYPLQVGASDVNGTANETTNNDIGGMHKGNRKTNICVMYHKLADLWHMDGNPFQLEDDNWGRLIQSRALSKCYVVCDDEHMKFGFAEVRQLSRYFAWDAPLGQRALDDRPLMLSFDYTSVPVVDGKAIGFRRHKFGPQDLLPHKF